ncbi:5-formyltetrahydrofolate cyclo-ligase [Amniculibacterium aquaticum]|jgi:5-formyltetrahydrofolate cyclo-ligase|uniref:5-formyltetrahydrofolate cyclo-ligase n=1 Tax=Amniculibacterium aquaticum TaxID=2479858 RepID=UPI000F596C82|nr:5-formyltetrahydrofolate cyclo-ligase [Amniculibacterium aquaticum]
MKKKSIREEYLQKRKNLSPTEVEERSRQIFHSFLSFFQPQKGQKVHLFLSIEKFKEVNTQFFIDYFFKNKIRVFVPKLIENEMITIELFPDTELVRNNWDIEEPKSNTEVQNVSFDFVLTPLLYCDVNGHRVGYGKGFYDQFFNQINTDAKKVGVNFFEPKDIIEDVRPEDVALDYLVLPNEVLSFGALISKSTK